MPNIIDRLEDAQAEKDTAKIINTLLPELFQAEGDGLIKQFPCKVGDTVYEVEKGLPIMSYRVTGFVIGKTEFEEDDDVSERHGWQIEYGRCGIDCECDICEFGRSLFLTREAAEKRLESEKK